MNRYPLDYSAQHITPQGHADNAGAFHKSLKPDVGEDYESQSLSDDNSTYFHYSKSENELEDDPNASLIAQTLNNDGTPKRPMNAFMIFARRRRPQVAAENQSMRTGEISKILSKEWNAMELTDKQFYLDQAKQLKDIFNSKYPNYVYRRRPNNSRRKRGMGGNRALDHALANDMVGDEFGNIEFDDVSPFDEDLLADVVATDLPYTRMPTDTAPAYDMHASAPYSYPSSDTSHRLSHGRAPYPQPGHQRHSPDVSLELQRLSHNMGSTHHYQQSHLAGRQSQSQPQALYALERSGWDQSSSVSRNDHARTMAADWPNGQERFSTGPHDKSRTPLSAGRVSWGGTTSHASPRSIGASSPNYPFPTLNTPFVPSQSHLTGNFPCAASPSSSTLSCAPAYRQSSSGNEQSNSQIRRPSSRYEHRNNVSSPHSYTQYQLISNSDQIYQQQTQHPSVQSLSSVSIPNIHNSSPASSGSGTPGF